MATILGIIAMMVLQMKVLNHVKVSGPVYHQVIEGKDLIADILPPPLYIIETHFTILMLLHEKDPTRQQNMILALDKLRSDYDDRHKFWTNTIHDEKLKNRLLNESYIPVIEYYKILKEEFLPAITTGNTELAFAVFQKLNAQYSVHRGVIDTLVKEANEIISGNELFAQEEIKNGTLSAILAFIALIIFILLIASKIIKEIIKISNLLIHANSIVVQGMGELSTGNQNLSSRTHEQASSLEETAATLEEITSTIKQTADNSQRASELSSLTVEMAEDGRQASERATFAMTDISESSRKIADIVGLVEDIAFQTNILAINAAIEAAKAGDQGKGFAVVAIEVRDLAQRSAEATKEIKELINTSLQKVENGDKIVRHNSVKLNEISARVKQVADILGEITVAAKEQFAAVEQINTAVTQLDSVTQQNASLVQEVASSSANLATESNVMGDLIKQNFGEGKSPKV